MFYNNMFKLAKCNWIERFIIYKYIPYYRVKFLNMIYEIIKFYVFR